MEPRQLIEEDSEFELFHSNETDDDSMMSPFPDELEAAAEEDEEIFT